MSTKPAGGAPASLIAAWLVHLFTATGVVAALFAVQAVFAGDWVWTFLWLGLALVVDGIDGSLARAAKVGERLERIDGGALDLVIDYLTYVFVPALLIWRAGLLPTGWEPWLASAILISSLYTFARRDMKTDDGYFRGFPALWNVVAFYLLVMQFPPAANGLVVAVLTAMTFAPVHVVHPFRVRDFGLLLPIVAAAWACSSAGLLIAGLDPALAAILRIASIASALLLVALGFVRTVRGPPR